ncbi:nucleotidyltransferase family protein [Priestia flexa]|uniref:nucleotidyltransferase domain-containing protein n=1 Tax=Priestia flexa TaxID=86664 RepID=UPI00203D8220|nr:nucleotidyltransferase family protein [Priestia flexa]MCM3067782.1 nucleotidyltransferase family protein [Priestia flexa]
MMSNHFKLDLTFLSKELKLLIQLVKSKNELKGIDQLQNIDWRLFLNLVHHHRCQPIIYLKLKDMPQTIVPLEVIQALQQTYTKNTFKMLQLSGEMEQISKLFAENEIKTLFLKGPALAHHLYGDISLRTSKDLDVLVRETDLDKVDALLLASGYVKGGAPFLLNGTKRKSHHVEYVHSQKKIQIEIHWRLHNPPVKEPSFDELWQRKSRSALTSSPVFFLGEEDLFLHLVVHGARHGWFRLRWLVDMDKVFQKKLDYQQVKVLMKKLGYAHLVGQAMILSSQLLNTPVNKELKATTEGSRPTKLAEKAYVYICDSKEITSIISYLLSLKSPVQKVGYLLTVAYPSYRDAQLLPLPKPLHFLYFPLRPFLWMGRKVKKLS